MPSIIVYNEQFSRKTPAPGSIFGYDWRIMDVRPARHVKFAIHPVPGHPDMVLVTPEEALKWGLFSLQTFDTAYDEFQFAVQTPDEEAFWRDALRDQPDSWHAHSHLGALLWNRHDIDGALEPWKRSAELKPQVYETHNNYALALNAKGRTDDALEQFKQAVSTRAMSLCARTTRHCCRVPNDTTRRSISMMRFRNSIPKMYGRSPRAGKLLFRRGGLGRVRGLFSNGVETQAGLRRGEIRSRNSGAKAGRPARRHEPGNRRADEKDWSTGCGHYDEAITQYSAVELDPENSDALVSQGNCYYATQEWGAAMGCYQRALVINPGSITVGIMYAKAREKADESYRVFQKAWNAK